MDEETKTKIIKLRNIVWLEDVPHPTVPEYIEHHDSITKILNYIDKKLLGEE